MATRIRILGYISDSLMLPVSLVCLGGGRQPLIFSFFFFFNPNY